MKILPLQIVITHFAVWIVGLSRLCAAPLVETAESGKAHTFTWRGNDGTPADGRKPVFEFDGETIPVELVVGFKAPSMRLSKGSVVEIVFPDDAKIDDPKFVIPLSGCGLVQEWIRMGVNVHYLYRGHVIARDELIFRFAPRCINLECAKVFLNGRKIGTGMKAIEELRVRAWRENGFMMVRFVHEYSEFPSLPPFVLPSDLWESLDNAKIKCEFSKEFLNMEDAWRLAK